MEKDTDLRIIRTRQMIKTAFFQLISEIGFEKITVQNITKKAVINRSTFYLHYTDKFHLLNQLENEILEGLKEILSKTDFDPILKGVSDEKPFPHVIKVLEYVKENEQFFTLIMSSNGDPSFINKMGEIAKFVMYEKVLRKGMFNKLKIPENYLSSLLISIFTSFINEWLKTGLKETPYEVAHMVTTFLRDVPKNLIVQSS